MPRPGYCLSTFARISAEAEFVLEGYIDPAEVPRLIEDPLGEFVKLLVRPVANEFLREIATTPRS